MSKNLKSFSTEGALGKKQVSEEQAAYLNNANNSKLHPGDIVVLQEQYVHVRKVKYNNEDVDSQQFFADIMDPQGVCREDTLALSNFNFMSYGKEYTGTIKIKTTDRGIRGEKGQITNAHITGNQPVIRADKENNKFLANTICFLVGEKGSYTIVDMAKNAEGKYDFDNDGINLKLKSTERREFTGTKIPENMELHEVPAEYRL